jgi:N-acetylneuraminic acid mutarotase
MAEVRGGDGQTATKLADGRVLVTGLSANAELFDPARGTWAPAGTVADALGGQTATTLNDGRILLAGGVGANDAGLTTAQTYQPTTGAWTRIAAMPEPRISGQAVRLADGRVLIAGGISANSSDGTNAMKTVVIFDAAGAR